MLELTTYNARTSYTVRVREFRAFGMVVMVIWEDAPGRSHELNHIRREFKRAVLNTCVTCSDRAVVFNVLTGNRCEECYQLEASGIFGGTPFGR
jgi:hypothetical protein